jgi:F-type H+-transporting ATPase subunit delta
MAPDSAVAPRDAVAQIQAFAEGLAGSPELRSALVSPAVPPARKRAVIERIAEQLGMARVLRNFLFVLADHRRTALMPLIAQAFDLAVDERLGFARAAVAAARPLDPEQCRRLETELGRLTGRTVRARYTVDESLMGGAVVRIGSTVYDGSLRGGLARLGRRLGSEG